MDLFDAILFNLDHLDHSRLDGIPTRSFKNLHERFIAYFENIHWKENFNFTAFNWTMTNFDFADFKVESGYLEEKEIFESQIDTKELQGA